MTREELIKILNDVRYCSNPLGVYADRILAAEKTDEATEKGLREELRAWLRLRPEINHMAHLRKEFEEILSRHPAPADKEPLAVLAYRKGFYITSIWPYANGEIEINLRYWKGPKTWEVFTAPTYEAAEAKAREWLEAQGDK